VIRVLINGENRNDYIRSGSIRIQKDLGESWTCEIASVSTGGDIETITGDGVSRQFQLSRIPANIPTLLLGGTQPLNVGIYGVDTGKDWYWEVGTRNIYEDDLSVTIPDGSIMTADLGTWYPSVGQTIQVQVAHAVSYEITGDGTTDEWALPQTARELLSLVANDSLPQTFGILGVDSGKQYYLDLDNNTLVADPLTGPLPLNDTLDVGYDYWVTVFGGIIRQVVRIKPAKASSSLLTCDITATDYNFILERRVVGEREWIGTTDNVIAQAILDNDLDGEGLTLNTGAASPATAVDVASFRTAYDTANGAFAALSNLTGKRFWIDGDKTLNYVTPTSQAAPFNIEQAAVNIAELRATETDEEYCNYVIVKSAQTLREVQTEEFDADGSATSFELAYPVGQAPTITLGTETQTVGIWGVDTGRDWYWNQGSKEIRQDADATPVTGTLSVTYAGIESSYLVAKDDAQIAARAAIEGSSGRYMKFFEIDRLLSQADAQAVAQGILESRYTVPLKVWYRTSDYLENEAKNLQPGQTQNMLLDGWAAQQNDYVVRSISMTAWPVPEDADWHFEYEVEMFYGAIAKTTYQWFKELAGGGAAASGGAASISGETEYMHFFLGSCDVVPTGTDIAPHRPHAHQPGRLYQVSSDCKTAPTGEDLVFDILRSDDNATWTSIFTTGSVSHPAGEDQVFFTDLASDNNVSAGTKFRVDVTSSGAAEGWALKIASKPVTAPPGELNGANNGDSQTTNVPTVL
jgi:hypothetical protein